MLHLDPGGEGVVYVKPSFGGAFKTKKKSTEVATADHMHLESKLLSMVHIDPGAGGIVYVQPQQRMVPSTLP